MKGLVPLFDALFLEAIEECVDCGGGRAVGFRVMFADDKVQFPQRPMFTAKVEVLVSPSHRSELREAVTVFSVTRPGGVVSAWRTFWEDGYQVISIEQAAAECEAELRADYPELFAAYDACQEKEFLAAVVAPAIGGTVRRL